MQDLSDPVSSGNGGAPPSRPLPLLFRVFNAITGSREEPATHNMPRDERLVLLAMANRAKQGVYRWGVALLEADTSLGASKVRACLASLLKRRWLRDLGMVGPANRAVRAFEVLDGGEAWPARDRRRETPTERRRRLEAEEAAGPRTVDPHATGSLPYHGKAPSHATGARPTAAREPGLPQHGDKPLSDPLQEPLKEPPTAAARGGGSKAVTFEPSKPKPKATDGYAQAWVDGNADAGARVSRPTASQVACLGRAAAAHARYRDGEAITGDDLLKWLRVKAKRFRSEVEDPSKQRGGMTPFGFLQWLDDDPDGRAAPWRRPEERAAAAQPAPPPAPPEPPQYTPEQAALADRFQRMLRGEPDPWRQQPAGVTGG